MRMSSEADLLFKTHFLPLYPANVSLDVLRSEDANPGKNPSFGAQLQDAAERFRALSGLDVELDYSPESVRKLGVLLTQERRDGWMRKPAAEGLSEIVPVVIHGAAYVGECIVRNFGGKWLFRQPLWESLVLIKTSLGDAQLPVFHWWLRSLSDSELGRFSLGDRFRTYVEEPLFKGDALPVLRVAPRDFPKATKTNYDTFYKYLKAHAPEIRDVGHDFPSPERFTDLKFKWFQMMWLGEGRMLLVFGQNQDGLHMFWLDGKGFRKSAFVPCDVFPEARVRSRDALLEIIVSSAEKLATHEMAWWGK
jgi:hypothetical protein